MVTILWLPITSKGIIVHIWEKIYIEGFSVLIDSYGCVPSPKNFITSNPLSKSQGGHALFGPWEFYQKILIFLLVHNNRGIILYNHVF